MRMRFCDWFVLSDGVAGNNYLSSSHYILDIHYLFGEWFVCSLHKHRST